MYLVFRPQQVEILAADAVANEVHPVVFDTKIQVSEPEDEPKNRAALVIQQVLGSANRFI